MNIDESFMHLCKRNDLDSIEKTLKENRNSEFLHTRLISLGMSMACAKNNKSLLEYFINLNKNIFINEYIQLFEITCKANYIETSKYIYEKIIELKNNKNSVLIEFLKIACMYNSKDIAEFMVDNGANINTRVYNYFEISFSDYYRYYDRKDGNNETFRMLIEKLPKNQRINVNIERILKSEYLRKNIKLIKSLLKRIDKIDKDVYSEYSEYCIYKQIFRYSIAKDDPELFDILLEKDDNYLLNYNSNKLDKGEITKYIIYRDDVINFVKVYPKLKHHYFSLLLQCYSRNSIKITSYLLSLYTSDTNTNLNNKFKKMKKQLLDLIKNKSKVNNNIYYHPKLERTISESLEYYNNNL